MLMLMVRMCFRKINFIAAVDYENIFTMKPLQIYGIFTIHVRYHRGRGTICVSCYQREMHM